MTQKNQKNWPSVYLLGAWLTHALPIACGLLAAFFGAATLVIVVARVNQPLRLFFDVYLPNIYMELLLVMQKQTTLISPIIILGILQRVQQTLQEI